MTEDNPTATPTAGERLAREIRRLRLDAKLSQQELARQVGYTRQQVSMAERIGRDIPSQALVRALDTALNAAGQLRALRDQAKQEQRAIRAAAISAGSVGSMGGAPAPTDLVAESAFTLNIPAGRYFGGATIPALRCPANDDGRIVMDSPADVDAMPFLRRPGRGLVVAAAQGHAGERLFALDKRTMRAKRATAIAGAPVLVPAAYELDDLTLGVLWATTNLDNALLDDDGDLADLMARLSTYKPDVRSTSGPEVGAGLSTVSRMWLGSDFCARHILRHADAMQDTPRFWTREQQGEEASTWLLFAHKYRYLAETAATFAASGSSPTRTFCVPPAAVDAGTRSERILLLLTVALMESFGICVEVCAEPEYSGVQGFALDQRRRAIVANWGGTDGVWQVDVTDQRPLLREFADASGYARSHSVIAASTPRARLQALADYLNLDWSWLQRRCAELGDFGTAGLAPVSSRLLSTAGMDRAVRFVGDIAHDTSSQ